MNSSALRGILALIGCCTIWGLSAIFYAELAVVPPLEVLCHRSLWSLVFFGVLLALQGRITEVKQALQGRRQIWLLLIASVLISGNWFGFIYSVANGYAVEASLGYYIFPLVAVMLGAVVLGERLGRLHLVAVALAAVAVATLGIGLGVAPWIAFWLAGTFSLYGLIKKQITLGPVVSVTAEVLLIAPFALGYLVLNGSADHSPYIWALLIVSGVLTGFPLFLFSYAAKRVTMGTFGVVQYLNPTLQFFVAALVLNEAVTLWHGIAFPMIWVALGLYSYAVYAQDRTSRRLASSAGTSGTIDTN